MKTRTIRRGASSLSARVREGRGSTTLFLHGWMMSGAVWDSMFTHVDLGDEQVIVPDARGAGASREAVGPFSLETLMDDALAWLDDLGVARARIVGHSMGGQLALRLASHAPERVSSVLAINPVPATGMQLPPEAVGLFRTSGGDRGKQATILGMACKQLADAEKERLLGIASGVSAACIEGAFDAWTGGGFQDRVASIEAPLAVIATDDPFLPPAFLRQTIVDVVPGARLVTLPGPGHYPQCERPVETAAIVGAFLAASR